MGRKRKNTGPHIYWRNGRAYADLRAYEDVGGGREALSEEGATWGTKDPAIAEAIFAARLQELQEKRRGRAGIAVRRSIGLKRLAADHLVQKAKAGQTSERHLVDLEKRLGEAVAYFGAERDPRSITADDVRAWVRKLEATPNGRGGTLSPVTQRNYIFALSGLFRRAIEGRYAERNPVAELVEKPRARRSGREARFFEVAEAALQLEAARVVEQQDRINATPGLHAIVATFMLTGGRKSEVLGLDVEDVSFDRKRVIFRENAHRGLKTETSWREVPLWPQLEEILRAHVFGGAAPRTSGLLFPSRSGGRVGDLRKSLDAIAEMCGLDEGAIRTRAWRHTYCVARLNTVQRIIRPGFSGPLAIEDEDGGSKPNPDAYEWVEVAQDQVAREMGHGGHDLVRRVYGHKSSSPHRAEIVEYRVEKHREQLGERLTSLEAAR